MSLISANKTETNTYAVEIAVSAEDFRAAIQKAYLNQRKSIQIPGFRKGKAPLMMIEKLYGQEVFFEDALDIVFPETVQAAYEEAGINPVDQPRDFDVKTMSKEEGVVMSFNVTVKPEITLKAYKGLTAEKAEANATLSSAISNFLVLVEQYPEVKFHYKCYYHLTLLLQMTHFFLHSCS